VGNQETPHNTEGLLVFLFVLFFWKGSSLLLRSVCALKKKKHGMRSHSPRKRQQTTATQQLPSCCFVFFGGGGLLNTRGWYSLLRAPPEGAVKKNTRSRAHRSCTGIVGDCELSLSSAEESPATSGCLGSTALGGSLHTISGTTAVTEDTRPISSMSSRATGSRQQADRCSKPCC
jgi:hypothetical protein